ncbi:hypothetical protein N7451_006800 [Penicillium sp. IBT 35674x]|nr:hypothetical protein N7451_006800 [Penicillium sp. IBT 35674x]
MYQRIETIDFCRDMHKSLVTTLLLHPELGLLVKSLRLGRARDEQEIMITCKKHKHNNFETQESQQRLANALKRIKGEQDKVKALESESSDPLTPKWNGSQRDAWLAILLSLTPNIENLELFWGGGEVKYTIFLLEAGLDLKQKYGRPCFESLHTVNIRVLDMEARAFSVRRLKPFLSIPSLRTFKGQYMTIGENEDSAGLFPQNLGLENLELQQCNGKEGWRALISKCKSLKSFIFTHWRTRSTGTSYRAAFDGISDPDVFISALNAQKGQIQSLTIDIFSDPPRFHCLQTNLDTNPYGFLADFTSLRHLEINATNFMGLGEHPPANPGSWEHDLPSAFEPELGLVDFLPPSLESFCLSGLRNWTRGPSPTIIFELEALANSTAYRFDQLKKIEIRDDADNRDNGVKRKDCSGAAHANKYDQLYAICERLGIELRIPNP